MDTDESYHLRNLQKGSIKSFETLYAQNSDRLYRFAMSVSNNDKYLSEEIVQEVFIKIWEIREQIDSEKSFGAYLFTIARNMLINYHQRQYVEYAYRENLRKEFNETHSEMEREVEYKLLNEWVDSIVEKLPEGRKKVYNLSRKQHLPNKIIAETLGISESTVEKQLASAIKFIRLQIMRYYDELLLIVLVLKSLNPVN